MLECYGDEINYVVTFWILTCNFKVKYFLIIKIVVKQKIYKSEIAFVIHLQIYKIL